MTAVDATLSIETETEEAQTPRQGLRSLLRSGQVRLGLVLIIFMVLLAELGRFFTPYDPNAPVTTPYAPPQADLIFGSDGLGRGVFSRILVGGENLAWMALAAAIGAVVLGAFVGIVGAFYQGIVDLLLMRVTDVILAFPALLFTLLFVSVIGPKLWLLVLLVGIGMAPGVARVVRGATFPLVSKEYVVWARTVGIKHRHILVRDVLPNLASPLMVEFGMRLMWSIGILASVSFVGYGIQPPTADWGLMISENRTGLQSQPWSVIAPALCVLVFTVGGNLVAEGSARVIGRTESEG